MRRWGLAAMLVLFAAACSREQPKELSKNELCADVKEAIRLIGWLERMSPGEHSAKVVDVSAMSAPDFRAVLEAMPGREVHVWMPGATTWLLIGNLSTNSVSLAAAMERFADDAKCTRSITDVFASYVGTREEILPAFASDLQGNVLPEWFVTKEIPALGWLDPTGVEEDILKAVCAEIRSVQVVRRLILEGNVAAQQAKDKADEEKAVGCWARAALRNPNDPLLRERIENLNRNAKGFLEVNKVVQALKCYETVALIEPSSAVAVHNFGSCLMRLGRRDIAEKVLARAKELQDMVK